MGSPCSALPDADEFVMTIPASPPDLSAVFPPFAHTPFERAGCNIMVLPFVYYSTVDTKKRSEADALAILISMDLDWIPTNYCRSPCIVHLRTRPGNVRVG